MTAGGSASEVVVVAVASEDVVATINFNVASTARWRRSSLSNGPSLKRGSTTVATHSWSSSNKSPNFSSTSRESMPHSTSRPPAVLFGKCCKPSITGTIIEIVGYDMSAVTSGNGRSVELCCQRMGSHVEMSPSGSAACAFGPIATSTQWRYYVAVSSDR